MKQKEKELLLADLCSRLTHNVKAYVRHYSKLDRKWNEGTYIISSVHPSLNEILVSTDKYSVEIPLGHFNYEIKPYLFPMSSMTDEQWEELYDALVELELKVINDEIEHYEVAQFEIEFYNKKHLDYRGLIPKGLALDATGLNIY